MAAAAVGLLVFSARAAPQEEPFDPGGGDCGGGPITVTVEASESEVLVGHDVTLTATVNGSRCTGDWQSLCPGDPAPGLYTTPPRPLTKTVCCANVGPFDYGYGASSGQPNGGYSFGRKTVTVVGPNDSEVTGYNIPSGHYSGASGTAVNLVITPLRSGEKIGPCLDYAPIVERSRWVLDESGNSMSMDQDWAEYLDAQWDSGERAIIHTFTHSCAFLNTVPENGPYGPKYTFMYRLTFGSQCGGQATIRVPGVVHVQRSKVGDCSFKIIDWSESYP